MEEFMTSIPTQPSAVLPTAEPPLENRPKKALSVVAARGVSPVLKKAICRERGRNSLVFSVLLPLLVLGMMTIGVFCLPDGSFSKSAMWWIGGTALVCLLWEVVVACRYPRRRRPLSFEHDRVNELYEQGAVCTGPFDRVVIEYDEVQSCVETRDWVALFGKDSEIVWLADELTQEDAATLFSTFAAHLPSSTLLRRAPLAPRRMERTSLPRFSFAPAEESYEAFWSAKTARLSSFSEMCKHAVPLFVLMSMVLSVVLCESFNFINEEAIAKSIVGHFASPLGLATVAVTAFARFWLMVAGVVVCLAVSYLLIAWEQNKKIRELNRRDVRLLVADDQLRIQNGADFIVLTENEIAKTVKVNDRYLQIRLDGRTLLVPRERLSAGTKWRQLVNKE